MQAELDDRRLRLMPELIEEVKRTRAFGDLSEKLRGYKAAKQEQNRNKSRIRYLERIDRLGPRDRGSFLRRRGRLYDRVTVRMVELGKEKRSFRIVTTVRCDAPQGPREQGSLLSARRSSAGRSATP